MTTLPVLTRSRVVRAALRLLTAAWIATEAGTALPQPTTTIAEEHAARAPVVAVFTGQFERGAPVYRLPSVSVSARRSVVAFEAQQHDARRARAVRVPAARAGSAS